MTAETFRKPRCLQALAAGLVFDPQLRMILTCNKPGSTTQVRIILNCNCQIGNTPWPALNI